MISYYELLLMISTKKQPYRILVQIDDVELLFEWNDNYNAYYIQPTTASEKFYKDYGSYLNDNIDEEIFFEQNIKVVSEYKFTIGEYVSYFDILNAIKTNSQPYKVRYHLDKEYNDYVYEENNYIEFEDNGDLPPWESHLSRQVDINNIFDKNIEIIEAGNNMLKIIEGPYGSSYFNIHPIKVRNYDQDTNWSENIIKNNDLCISIEEDDVLNLLFPILVKYFNDDLEENKKRSEVNMCDYKIGVSSSFDWNLTYNYYTFDDVKKIITELKKIIELLDKDFDNPYLDYVKTNYDYILFSDRRINSSEVLNSQDNTELIKKDKFEIINFYKRFIYYLEKMVKESGKDGYHLISFMGP